MTTIVRTIHQLTAGFANGDAISNEAIVIRNIIRSWGYHSEIFSETKRILPALRKTAHDVSECAASIKPDDIVILHLSIGSIVNEVFADLHCRKVIIYHNVTPPHYFDSVNKSIAWNLKRGREHVLRLANVADVNTAVSKFNASELVAAGYRDVKVFPLILDLNRFTGASDRKAMRQFKDGRKNILFVGRCVPNKRIEDLIKAFAYFNFCVEPESRLIHVGSFAGTERYYYMLQSQARELPADSIYFAGSVTEPALNAFYNVADLFLCMSEHEGFCIPLIESMMHDVPVLAYAAAAVPETLDGAGVLIREKKYDLVAEMMGEMVNNHDLRDAILAGQRDRLDRYKARNLENELRALLAPLMN